jgi:glycosyltransferase involved in cell wall biosynthesis
MDCTVSIVIATFQRANLLEWGLFSLANQNIPFSFETIVVNDGLPDATEDICRKYREKLHLKYVFSGSRNYRALQWRVPGFAYNIGVRQSAGRVLILSCAEMFHIGDTIAQLTQAVLQDDRRLAIPVGKDDQEALFLSMLASAQGEYDPDLFDALPDLNVTLPFLMALDSAHFTALRGYDEDFTGIAFDDLDIVARLLAYGCTFLQTGAQTVHLYHPRLRYQPGENLDWHYNHHLYLTRRDTIVRNLNREWGEL